MCNFDIVLYCFNKRCKTYDVLPPSLLHPPPLKTPMGFKIARSNAFRFLNAYIQDGYKRLNNSNHEISSLRTKISEELPDYLILDLENYINHRKITYRKNLKNRLILKFDKLAGKQYPKFDSHNDCIKNLSSYDLTNDEVSVLKKGLNFSLPNTKKNIPKFIASAEHIIDNLKNVSEEQKAVIRNSVSGALKNTKKDVSLLTRAEASALKGLKQNEDIIISPADKGRAVVILNKSDYINKCQDHLNDTDTYTLKNSDNSICLRKQINSFLKKLFDSKLLTRTQYTKLFANSATLPLFMV